MRIAALYDIHGNLPALEAVLQEVRQEQIDLLVIGGDVLPGPMPVETIDCLTGLPIPVQFIQGNGDREVLAARQGRPLSNLPKLAQEVIRWTANQLSARHEGLVTEWLPMLRLPISDSSEAFFCHATPQNDTDIFTRLTPEAQLLPIFEALHLPLVICGHTHMQFDRLIGTTRVLNAGSVGMPFGPPGAYWLSFHPEPQLRHTPYDLPAAAERIRATSYPEAEEFASRNVLSPRSEAEMLALFGRAEL